VAQWRSGAVAEPHPAIGYHPEINRLGLKWEAGWDRAPCHAQSEQLKDPSTLNSSAKKKLEFKLICGIVQDLTLYNPSI